MKERCAVFLAISLFFLPITTVTASPEISKDAVRVITQKHILDNGLTVLISEMPAGPLVSVYALVKTGSATEGKFIGTGISHFLEHMVFKGTEKREVGAIAREIQALGGVMNAATSFDYTIYTITVPREGFAQALDIMSDALMHSRFDPDELEKEREVIYGEMRLYKDRPRRYLSRMVFNTVYIRHPYRLPVIGHEELLGELKRDDFLEYYRAYYTPDNIILSIAGNVKAGEALAGIKQAFKDFRRRRPVSRNLPQEPSQIGTRHYEEEYPTELTRMSMSFTGVSLLDKDMFALDVLAMILGQGESSRLYQELFKKRKLVRSVSASNFTPMDQGIFEIECVLDQENVEETIQAIRDQIQAVIDKGVESVELEKTKRQVLSHYIHSRQTSGGIAYGTAADEAFAGDHSFSEKYVTAIRGVTRRDIKRVAAAYLVDNHLSIVILRPKGDKEATTERAEAKAASEIKKIVLENGLTILLRENHAVPLVTVNLVLNGGSRQEPVELNGISNLTSRLWVKGTRTRSAREIAESVESLGASLNGFSGRNSFGMSLNMLSEDLDFGIDLLEDLIRNPSFDPQELIKEKEKVRTAIIARNDSIYQTTAKALRETLFKTHPFRLEKTGTLESVEKITRQDILGFHEKLADPGNMVLSIFGDFRFSRVLEILTKKLSRIKHRKTALSLAVHHESPPDTTRKKTIYPDKEQAMVMIGFQGVDFLHEDRYGLEVMASILGSSFSGRIFNGIREKLGQAYTLGGGFLPGKDMGFISFYVLTKAERVQQVNDILLDLINEIREDDVTKKELQEIKSYLKGRFQREIETDASLGFMSTLDELYGAGYDHYRHYNDRIDSVTRADIKRLAQTYLDIKKAAIVIAKPKKKDNPDG